MKGAIRPSCSLTRVSVERELCLQYGRRRIVFSRVGCVPGKGFCLGSRSVNSYHNNLQFALTSIHVQFFVVQKTSNLVKSNPKLC